ncbi:hypothetical protein H7F30_12990 [Dermacoccus sp. PAMC28757]|uniref:hypothetical protein n=1 Tax=Dermacoccus sp. PAMC28757 TaxID=2762331 RepID=UPI00164E789E|nr:hypothetical protein [Dermacoccus sp. PAMC28757]QNK52488.1 hypothetical protein H7F30_12990 [Dermacoccus sp. PAMC28757]
MTTTQTATVEPLDLARTFVEDAFPQVLPEGVSVEVEQGYRLTPPASGTALVRIAGATFDPYSESRVLVALDVATYYDAGEPLEVPANYDDAWRHVRLEGVASVHRLSSRADIGETAGLATLSGEVELPDGRRSNLHRLEFAIRLGERQARQAPIEQGVEHRRAAMRTRVGPTYAQTSY